MASEAERLTAVELRCGQNAQDIAVLKESEKAQKEDITDLQGALKVISELTRTLHTDAELIKREIGGFRLVSRLLVTGVAGLLITAIFGPVIRPATLANPELFDRLDSIERQLR